MLKNLFSLYSQKYPKALVSLMYSSHYSAKDYLKKLHKTKNFNAAIEKSALKNKKNLVLVAVFSLGILLQIITGVVIASLGLNHHIAGGLFFGLAIILLYPFAWAYVAALVLILKEWFKYGYGLDKAS
jgi:hypothetical protein